MVLHLLGTLLKDDVIIVFHTEEGKQNGGRGHCMVPCDGYRAAIQDAPGAGYEFRAQVRASPHARHPRTVAVTRKSKSSALRCCAEC